MIDEVGALLRATAASVVLPAFRHLDASEIEEKAPGELVTVADRRSEEMLSAGLRELLPGSTVVGEEGVAADPGVLSRLSGPDPVWVIDPIDGTANFAAGREPFAIMLALLRDGIVEAGWILDPVADTLMMAQVGTGSSLDGAKVRTRGDSPPPESLRGVGPSRYVPADLHASARSGARRIGELLPGQHCAGREYQDVALGKQDFVFFWRTLPWDHLPGILLVEEAGGVARRLDGDAYDPTGDASGLLVAANEEIWETVRDTLF